MALLMFDRVMEMSATAGTGAYALTGPPFGFRSFAVVGNGGQCYYCAEDVDAAGKPSGQWEVGIGTYTAAGTTLARTTILASSNANALVVWGAGTRRVFLTAPAAKVTLTEDWQDIPFNAANFYANGGGTWTVAALAVKVNRYTRVKNVMHWQIYVSWYEGASMIAGTVTALRVLHPLNIAGTGVQLNPAALVMDQTSAAAQSYHIYGAGNAIELHRNDFANVPVGAAGFSTIMTWELT